MTENAVDIVSTSSVTASASPVVLNKTDTIRFKFIPTLVANENDPKKSVSGKLLYEKKRKSDEGFPSDGGDTSSKITRRSAKVGDWMEINLNTAETFELYQGLKKLYDLYENMGSIPYGTVTKKTGTGYGVTKAKYEYEDLAKLARERETSIREIREVKKV